MGGRSRASPTAGWRQFRTRRLPLPRPSGSERPHPARGPCEAIQWSGQMRIAQIARSNEACPPPLYGGTERVVSYVTEALVELGHDVTLFASGDSQTGGRLEPAWRG